MHIIESMQQYVNMYSCVCHNLVGWLVNNYYASLLLHARIGYYISAVTCVFMFGIFRTSRQCAHLCTTLGCPQIIWWCWSPSVMDKSMARSCVLTSVCLQTCISGLISHDHRHRYLEPIHHGTCIHVYVYVYTHSTVLPYVYTYIYNYMIIFIVNKKNARFVTTGYHCHFQVLRPHANKVRCVLNKARQRFGSGDPAGEVWLGCSHLSQQTSWRCVGYVGWICLICWFDDALYAGWWSICWLICWFISWLICWLMMVYVDYWWLISITIRWWWFMAIGQYCLMLVP